MCLRNYISDSEAAMADVSAEHAHTDHRTDAEEATLVAEGCHLSRLQKLDLLAVVAKKLVEWNPKEPSFFVEARLCNQVH